MGNFIRKRDPVEESTDDGVVNVKEVDVIESMKKMKLMKLLSTLPGKTFPGQKKATPAVVTKVESRPAANKKSPAKKEAGGPTAKATSRQKIKDAKRPGQQQRAPYMRQPQMHKPKMQTPQMQHPQMQQPVYQQPQMQQPQMQQPVYQQQAYQPMQPVYQQYQPQQYQQPQYQAPQAQPPTNYNNVKADGNNSTDWYAQFRQQQQQQNKNFGN